MGVKGRRQSKGMHMSEDETVSVEEQDPQAVALATEPEVQEKGETPAEKRARDDQAYNWAEANRKLKELSQQNREMQEQFQRLQQPKAQNEYDEIDKLADDDIVTKAQAKKMAAKMAREIANEVIKQREVATVDERLSLKFPDFAEIVTKENIELLKQTEPELALSLMHTPDPFAQGVAAYKLMKKLHGGADVSSKEKEKALKNSQKPVSVNTVSKASAIGNAHMFENGLTPELKSQLRKEMEECRKRG